MDQPQERDQESFGESVSVANNQESATAEAVTVLRGVEFGTGAFGVVCKAKRNDTPCAAKILHPYLCNDSGSQPIEQFLREIQLVLEINHPNIVQCLGIHTDYAVSQMPILLMELMDCNLTSYLTDKSVSTISYYEQLKICHDIVLALAYLHSFQILHRDLSGKNILLTLYGCENNYTVRTAKVGDFGVAKAYEAYDSTANQLTTCPGTLPYMPPEALTSDPSYTEKIDCFSFGVLIVQILTTLFPKPTEESVPVGGSDRFLIRVPEIKRRQDHIDKINPNNPLLPIAKICLNNTPDDRPSSQSMYESIKSLVNLRFVWSDGTVPYEMSRYCNAALNNGIVYLLPADSINIYAYDTTRNFNQWTHRCTSQYLGSSLTFINDELVTIGGKRLDVAFRYEAAMTAGYATWYTNKLWSIDMQVEHANWTNKLPSMPTKRAFTVALNTGANLIVAGGVGGAYLKKVEIMDIEKSQWMTAADLPHRMWGASGTLCGDSVYLLGGIGENSVDLSMALTCSVENLLKSCESGSLLSILRKGFTFQRSDVTSESVWEQLADVPVTRGTCVSFHGHVLTIGGKDPNGKPSTNIHMYDQVTRTWMSIDHIPSPRYSCFAVVLHKKIFIIGGNIDRSTRIITMSIATPAPEFVASYLPS